MVFHHYLWSLFLHFDIVLLMFHMLFSIDQYFHIIDLFSSCRFECCICFGGEFPSLACLGG